MNIETILKGLWTFLNSGPGYALIWAGMVGFFIFLYSRFNPFQEKWKEWEGSIITGIKLAEKQIPDDTPNGGLAKLDAALRFVLNAYAEANNGQSPSAKIIEQIKQGIQIKHNELDRLGGLSKPEEAA
jgi:hypothetical protein